MINENQRRKMVTLSKSLKKIFVKYIIVSNFYFNDFNKAAILHL